MTRPRLLLADGVGLGKTVEAGLVLTELMARRIAHRILVVSPAGPLLDQWKLEMLERFGLRFDVVDRARLEEICRAEPVRKTPPNISPGFPVRTILIDGNRRSLSPPPQPMIAAAS